MNAIKLKREHFIARSKINQNESPVKGFEYQQEKNLEVLHHFRGDYIIFDTVEGSIKPEQPHE